MAIERYLAVCRPHHYREIQTDSSRWWWWWYWGWWWWLMTAPSLNKSDLTEKKSVWRKVLRLNWMCLWADSWPIPIVRMCKSLLLSLATFIFIESLKPKLKMCVSVSTNLKSNDQDEETWDGCLTPMMVSEKGPTGCVWPQWHYICFSSIWDGKYEKTQEMSQFGP